MDSKTTIQHNKLMQLENSMVMYGIYNVETLEQLINTVHSFTTPHHVWKNYLQGRKAH